MITRRCNKCETTQSVEEFYPSKKSKDGIDTWCKTCHFAKKLRRQYKLTPQTYDAILVSQGGVCMICKTPPIGKRLSVDHDHACCPGEVTCGECVRGLLCHNCNWWLGLIDDDLGKLVHAENYLRRYQDVCTVRTAAETSSPTRPRSRDRNLTWRASFAGGVRRSTLAQILSPPKS